MPTNDLSAWIERFPEKLVERELAELEREAARIEVEIRNRRRLLEARNQYLGIAEDPDGQVRLGRAVASSATRQRARERELALSRRTRLKGSTAVDVVPDAELMEVEVPPRPRASRPREVVDSSPRASAPKKAKGGGASPGKSDQAKEPQSMSRAEKLLWFLGRYRGEAWRLSDIRERLVQDGLLGDTDADTHGLQVTASRLYRTGRLERPELGYYRLPADDKEID